MVASSCLRILFRASQVAASALALGLVASGFVNNDMMGYAVMLGSHATNFALLMTWASVLFALYQLLVVECFQGVPRPSPKASMAADAVVAVVLAVTGVVLATSEYVTNCDQYPTATRCSNFTAGTVFTFVSACLYVVTIVLAAPNNHDDRTDIFFEEATPKVARDGTTAAAQV